MKQTYFSHNVTGRFAKLLVGRITLLRSYSFWNGLKCMKCTTKATVLSPAPPSPHPPGTHRDYEVGRILSMRLLWWTFNAVGEFGIKVKTIDRWLYPTANHHRQNSRARRRQEARAAALRRDGPPEQRWCWSEGHNQHSLLSVGWIVWTSSLNNECNCGPTFDHCRRGTQGSERRIAVRTLVFSFPGSSTRCESCDQIPGKRALV